MTNSLVLFFLGSYIVPVNLTNVKRIALTGQKNLQLFSNYCANLHAAGQRGY